MRDHLKRGGQACKQFRGPAIRAKTEGRTGRISHREMEIVGTQQNTSGKLASFRQITETSLFGKHEMLHIIKFQQIHFTCKQENICSAETPMVYPKVQKTWLYKLVIFPFRGKMANYYSNLIIEISKLTQLVQAKYIFNTISFFYNVKSATVWEKPTVWRKIICVYCQVLPH